MRRSGLTLILASALVALGLVGVVWVDYNATRRELVGLLRDQAEALRGTVAAAARSNRVAGALAEGQLAERLRDQARALAALDREGRLTREVVDGVESRNPLFRVAVVRADGVPDPLVAPTTREVAEAPPADPRGGYGRGRGGGRRRGTRSLEGDGTPSSTPGETTPSSTTEPDPEKGVAAVASSPTVRPAGEEPAGKEAPGQEAPAHGAAGPEPSAGEESSIGGRGGGRGEHGGPGRGPGAGFGRRGGGVVRQILEEGKPEVVIGVHLSRWGGGERLAAGVKRPGGGAIAVTVDASAIAQLQKPASLELLLEEVTQASPEIAYTIFEHETGRLAYGDVPEDEGSDGDAAPAEREMTASGRPVLEFASEVPLEGGEAARLRLGMRLDGVHRVEHRMGVRLAASLLAASGLVALAFGLTGLRRRYGALSEKHARAEEALRRRDRLVAMGELASTVAHEVRNPLNAVGMTAQRLRREFLEAAADAGAERAELDELLGVMTAETQRIDRIIQQFLDYARPPKLRPERTDLGALVRDLAERTRPLAEARGVSLEVDAGGAGEVRVDPAQLRQALDNLVRNAIDATPEGGQVVVTAGCEKRGCSVEVRDSGRGIEPDHLPRIFDLYFTTKTDGTGVGLAVTQQIVTAHGGTIEVDSRPGDGTSMTVRLPDAAGGGEGG